MDKKEDISRRDFLKTVGYLGGSGGLYGLAGGLSALLPLSAATADEFRGNWNMQHAGPRDDEHEKIVILGAGMAGLTVAYELKRMGYESIILEARRRPGGRVETLRGGSVVEETDAINRCNFDAGQEFYFNTGAARIPQHHKGLLSYIREFDIPLETLMNDNRGAYLYSGSAYGDDPVRKRAVHASLRGNIAEMLWTAIERGALDDVLSYDEQTLMRRMLTSYGDLGEDMRFTASTRGGIEEGSGYLTPAVPLPAFDWRRFLNVDAFSQLVFHFNEFYDQQSTMLQPVGGMDRTPYAFARRLEDNIHYGHEINAIQRTPWGVRISYTHDTRPGVINARHAVITLPASVLRHIPNDFSSTTREAIDAVGYSTAAKAAFQSERFWERQEAIYGGISWTDEDITQIWYPSGGMGHAEGIIVGAYIFDGPRGEHFAQLGEAERLELCLAQGERIHPQYRRYLKNGITRSWPKTPYSLGGWAVTPTSEVWEQADGPYIFAGEHTSFLHGWQEGAIASAQRALELLAGAMRHA